MKNKTRKIILLTALLFFLFLGYQTFANGKLEVNYPTIPGVDKPQTVETPLSTYLKYIYNFLIYLGGFLSLVLLTWAGIQYITSTGKVAKMAEAKGQIANAFLGLIIIFTSYLILNTISPDLVLFPPSIIQDILPVSVPPVEINESHILDLKEIPLGAMITSERGPSAFISTSTGFVVDLADLDTSLSDYTSGSSDVLSYTAVYREAFNSTSTRYQGALEGRRLKRIHEVATTTFPVINLLKEIYGEFLGATDELVEKIDNFYTAVSNCGCNNCHSSECTGNGVCLCDCSCEGDFCPDIDDINALYDAIPDYMDPNSLLDCKLSELEYYALAFQAFLDGFSQLVKNEEDDYKDNSFWHSDKAVELQEEIRLCVALGRIEQEQYDKIEEMIDLMAGVENKGTHSPRTDPPERDLETNIDQMDRQLQYLLSMRVNLNPVYQERPVTHGELFTLKRSWETIYKEVEFDISSSLPELLRAVDDPATFYRPASSVSINEYSPVPENTVFAQEQVTCARIIEVPMGKTLDEAIKLVRDILRELKNIRKQGNLMVKKVLEVTDEEKGLALQMFEAIERLLSLAERLRTSGCGDFCHSECHVPSIYPYIDAEGKSHCKCFCGGCQELESLTDLKAEIRKVYLEIKFLQSKMESFFHHTINGERSIYTINGERSIYESFYKFRGRYPDKDLLYPDGHPNAGEKAPMGKDLCCTDEHGDCRDDNKNLVDTEERDYTIIEKLVEVQKLLNRSRAYEDFKYLIEQLGPLLADEQEIENAFLEQTIGHVRIGGKYSLSDCTMTLEALEAQTEETEAPKTFENCQEVKYYNQIALETCNPYDPPLDCDYFDATIREKKTPLNCYCYDELWYPEYLGFASNFFCCVEPKLPTE